MTSALLLAQLSNAAYLADAHAAVRALSLDYVAQVGDFSCQALIVRSSTCTILALQGTRVLEHADILEMWDDLDDYIVMLKDGTRVHHGFWEPLCAIWPAIVPYLPSERITITGHSMGGVRAHLARALWPQSDVVSFGGPKGADQAFWSKHYTPGDSPLRFVYERDFAPVWPYEGPFTHPAKIQWLHAGGLTEVQNRPGMDFSVADHSIDQAYIPALTALAARVS